MTNLTMWHNPRCSKSRQTLELLHENGHEPEIFEYLKTAPDQAQIQRVLVKLDISAHELVRKGDPIYKELGLSTDTSDEALVEAMHQNPTLIERPIVITDEKAAIGRPPEQVLEIL